VCKGGSELNVLNKQLYIQDLGEHERRVLLVSKHNKNMRQSDDRTLQSAVNFDHLQTIIHLYVKPKSLLAALSQQLSQWQGKK
jgi:hypothetical protein